VEVLIPDFRGISVSQNSHGGQAGCSESQCGNSSRLYASVGLKPFISDPLIF